MSARRSGPSRVRTRTERTLQPGSAGARRVRGMGRHLAVGCLAQRASRPSRGPRAPPPPLGDGGPSERDRHREADRVDCVRIVHLTEACDDDAVHLITHAMTTAATVHEARCTEAIHAALAGKGLVPAEHLVDAAYVDAELLVREPRGRTASTWSARRGRTRAWQAKVEGGYTTDRFEVDWDKSGSAARRASCPRPGTRRSTRPARPTSRSGSARPTAAPARRGPCARGPGRPGTSGCTRGPSTRRSRPPGGGSRPRRAGAPTPGGPGSRAPSRKGCAPSACAAAATAGWPGRTCSTSRPRPRSTSSASPPGSGRPRAPPPAPPASPRSHRLSRLRQRYPVVYRTRRGLMRDRDLAFALPAAVDPAGHPCG